MNQAIQIEWIKTLQHTLRSRPMDLFFFGWDYLDSMGFTILVVSFVMFFINRKIAIKIFYLFVINDVFIIFLKNYFAFPRPCQIDLAVGLTCPSSFGFPSGAAQMAILYAGIMWLECKKTSWRIIGLVFAFFLCFSRIYLGVHFITDILAGLAFGGAILALYYWLFPYCEKKWKTWAFLVPLFPFFFLKEEIWVFPLILLGAGLGLLFKFRAPKSYSQKAVGAVVTAVGSLACFIGFLKWPQYTFFFTMLGGFWITYLGGALRLKLSIKFQLE